jgi:hypothetical protein
MKRTGIDAASRAVSWFAFLFALGCIGFGGWVWFNTAGRDAGGVFALAFICGGVLLAIPSLSFALTGKLRGLL